VFKIPIIAAAVLGTELLPAGFWGEFLSTAATDHATDILSMRSDASY
jgi:hypothetical protein